MQMSYEITEGEKLQAEKVMRSLDKLIKDLKTADKTLDLMYNPFKNKSDISPEEVFKIRVSLREYRDTIIEKFNIFKKQAFLSYSAMQLFISDTQLVKIVKSFIASINDMEKQVNRFAELFSQLDSKDFVSSVLKGIELIKKECAQVEEVIENRVKPYFQDNIISKTWVDNVGEELQKKIKEKTPLMQQLLEQKNKVLENKNQ